MNFEAAALETFQILRSYDYDLKLFDEESNAVFEPEKARRFWAEKANLLVAILDNGEDSSVRLNLSRATEINAVLGLVQALRTMATKYKMIFRVKKFNRKLSPKDFATHASISEATNKQETERNTMNIVEGMYGTSRSSYLKLENARMIVRHSARINEESFGARGRNVDAVYIENNLGERHRFATTQLAPARAMAHHVSNGGNWADNVGAQISRMAGDFANLGTASRHIGMYSGELAESAQDTRATIREAMREMRRTFEGFARKNRYGEICEALEAQAAEPLNEGEENTARLDELAGLLNTSRVSLSESVIGSVARVLEAEDRRMKLSNERNMQTVNVLGHPVNVEAWNAFKSGTIDFGHAPDLSKVPNFSNENDRKLYMLNEIVAGTKDDSLTNLFNAVLDGLPSARGKTRNGYIAIAMQMLKCVDGPAPTEKVAAGSAAVAEHLSWMKGFGRPETLNEYDRFEEPDDREWDHAEGVLHDLVNGFDFNAFMASSAGEEFNYSMLGRLDDEERTVEFPRIVAAIESFLDDQLAEQGVTGMHTHSDAEHLAKSVAGAMAQDGYNVTGGPGESAEGDHHLLAAEGVDEFDTGLDGEIDENCGDCPADKGLDGTAGLMDEEFVDECDLQQEDVLLPKNQNADFVRDITKPEVTDPDTGEEKAPDSAYIDRLRALAGMGAGQR